MVVDNAVLYHFGSSGRLIEAIFLHRITRMEVERAAMLSEAHDNHRLGTSILILALPHLSLCNDRGHHPHAGFLIHYRARRTRSETARGLYAPSDGAPTVRRVLDLLLANIAHLPPDIVESRVALCGLMFLNMLVRHDVSHPTYGDPVLLARHAMDTLEGMTAALREPFRAGGWFLNLETLRDRGFS